MATRWALTVPFTGIPLTEHPKLYRQAEAAGYDDLWSGETANGTDGFTPLALAAELADGAFTNFLPLSGLPQVVGALRAGEEQAGVEIGVTELVCRFFLLPMPEEQAIGMARLMFSAYGSVPVYTNFFRWLGWGEQLDPMVEAYEAGDRQRAAELAPVELMREIFLFGSPGQIKERLERFTSGGITTCILTLMAPPEQIPGLIDALAP